MHYLLGSPFVEQESWVVQRDPEASSGEIDSILHSGVAGKMEMVVVAVRTR